MTTSEPSSPPARRASEDLIRRVEAAYLAYRAEHPGKRFRRADLNAVIKTSYGPLCEAANIVEDRLDATETRLAALPEMPEELRLVQEQFLKDLWVRTREIGATEATALRRIADEREARRLADAREAQELMCMLEAERDAAQAEAQASQEAHATLLEEYRRLREEHVIAEARLADREALMEMLHERTARAKPQSTRKPKAIKEIGAGEPDTSSRPYTPNLPMPNGSEDEPHVSEKPTD